VWPFEYFADPNRNPYASGETENAPTGDYRDFLDDAIELRGEPGDILYWPSTYWHIALGDGKPHMTFNVSPYFATRVSGFLDKLVGPMVRESLGDDDWLHTLPYEVEDQQALVQKLPTQVAMGLSTYRKVLAAPRLNTLLMAAWAKSVTGCGFQILPPPDASVVLDDRTTYAGNTDFPVVYQSAGQHQRAVSANGHLFVARSGPVFDHVISIVNAGEGFTLDALMSRIGADPESADTDLEAARTEAASYLQKLLMFRAIQKF